jgi:hypothetical protein
MVAPMAYRGRWWFQCAYLAPDVDIAATASRRALTSPARVVPRPGAVISCEASAARASRSEGGDATKISGSSG